RASKNTAPKVEEFRRWYRRPSSRPVVHLEPFADRVVQAREALRLAANDGNRQTRRAPRNRTNRASGLDAPPPGSGADFITLGRLGGQQLFDPLGCGCLVDALDGGKLAHQTVERGLVDLAFAVGLLRLAGVTKKIADHLGD